MRRLGWPTALALAALAVPVAAATRRRGPIPEVDVAVKTNLRLAPEHTEAYLATLFSYSRMCLGGLFDRAAKVTSGQMEDGAAHYRLTVVHTGTLVTANSPKVARAVRKDDSSAQYLLTQQKGRFQFDLARWTGTAYESVGAWTSNFATVHHTTVPAGVKRAEMPKWRRTATMRADPEAVKAGILGRLLPVRVLRTTGPPGGTQHVVVSLANESLWPLKTAKVSLAWSDQKSRQPGRYYAELNYAGLLMPGQKTTLRGTGDPRNVSYVYELARPMQITVNPTFDPTRGPVWVRRHTELMKQPASRSAAARVIQRALGRMTPLEMKVVAEALVALLAHDAPRSDADVPQDVRRLLEQVGSPAVPLLADGLTNENPGIRLGAACVLQHIKVTDPAVHSRLRAALKDACEPVRAAAAKALEANGWKPQPEPDATQPQKTE